MIFNSISCTKICCSRNKKQEKSSKGNTNEGDKLQQYLCATLVSVGAVIIGTSLGWMSPALKYLINENYTVPAFSINDEEANWVAALTPAGAIFGAIPGGMIADHFGRRATLIAFCIPNIASWLLKAYSTHIVSLYIARFVVGFIAGIFASIIPTYLVEIAEVSVRGSLGSFYEISINSGVLLIYITGYFDSYYILCNGNAVLCVLYFLCLLFIPETPTYFTKKNNFQMAEKSLRKLRGPKYNVQRELVELRSFLANEMERKFSFSVLRRKANIKALIISSSIVVIQQLTAIDGILAFAETIFIKANATSPTLYVIILGFTQFIFSFVSTFVVDRLGRKLLLIVSNCGTALCLASLGYYFWALENNLHTNSIPFTWLPIVSLVLYMATFALGLGPVVWIICSEILGPEIKKFAFGLAVAFNLVALSTIVYSFMPLMKLLTVAGTFWMFAIVDILSSIYIIYFVPETKNKTLQQIQNELGGNIFEKTDTNKNDERTV